VTANGGSDPHAKLRMLSAGSPLNEAAAAVVLLHGRGSRAESILPLWKPLSHAGVAYLAPQAAGKTWYPHSFLAPRESNEPALSSALRALDRVLGDLGSAGIPPERTLLFGFSQGACVAVEYAARRPGRYGGVAALIGGLFGPMGAPLQYSGSLEGTPVALCTSDPDRFVPAQRVRETADVLTDMGARVELRVEPGAGHVVTAAGLERARSLVRTLAGSAALEPRIASRPDRAAPRPAPSRAADRRRQIRPTVP
jgi:predicted esterase